MKSLKQLLRTGLIMVMALFASVQMAVAMAPAGSGEMSLDQQLMNAVENNDPVQARMLIARGASVNSDPQTLMAYVISSDEPNIELVEILLKNGPKDRYIYNAHIQQLQRRLQETGAWYLARRNFDRQALLLFNAYTK